MSAAPSIIAYAPSLKDKKLLTFTHEHVQGFTLYHAVVPASFQPPEGTIGGEQAVDETPELWDAYKVFIDLLEIDFDPDDGEDFLSCTEEPMTDIPMLDGRYLP